MVRRFADLRAPQVADLGPDSVLVQPVGAIEQHGPHLPLSTDLLIAEAAAEAAVAARPDLDLWLLPPLAYTKSNEHARFPGTIWLSASTLLAVLDDLGRSVAATPARRLAFVNGHGGNTALLNVALRDLRLAHGLATFLLHPSVPPDARPGSGQREDVSESERGMGIHAGLDETSVVLHLRPDLVDMATATAGVPEAVPDNRSVRFGGPVTFGWTADDFGPSGVIGDPTGATAERGGALFAAGVAALGEALGEVATFDPTASAR